MNSVPALCVLVLMFGIIVEKSEAKLICQCKNNVGITADIYTGIATNSCGDIGKFSCYVYAAKPYCEVGNSRAAFETCCNNYGEDIEGVTCEEIS